jgi:hypothetical protein
MTLVRSALRRGLALVSRHKRLIVPFYLASFLFGLLVTLPLGALLDRFVGGSLMREQLGLAMDYNLLFEFLVHNSTALASLQGLLLLGPVVYWLFALFLSGGALDVYANDTYRPKLFWGASAEHFAPFLRLLLMSLPLLALFFSVRYLEPLVQRLLFGSDPYQYVVFWGAWIKMALGYVGLLLFGIVFDYARLNLVVTGDRRARRSLWFALKFAARNPVRTFALAFILFIVGWLALAIYYPLSSALSGSSWAVLISLFVLQQLYIVFRLVLRLTFYSGQLALYRSLSTDAPRESGSNNESYIQKVRSDSNHGQPGAAPPLNT